MITLSIIIVVYNQRKELQQLLFSLPEKSSFEIIVVDNASHDKTDMFVKNMFPKIGIARNKKNLGFAKAANQGARQAKGEFLLFLNPDAIVEKNCIETMIKFLKKKKDAIAVGCKIKNPDGSLQPSCGNFPTIPNVLLDRMTFIKNATASFLIRNKEYYSSIQSPDWITGAFFMTRKKKFLALGGFDEKYFLYGEDVDFCYRARKKGYEIVYNPHAAIIHLDMGKSKERKQFKAIQVRIGLSLFFQTYTPSWYSRTWRSILFVEHLLRPRLSS